MANAPENNQGGIFCKNKGCWQESCSIFKMMKISKGVGCDNCPIRQKSLRQK